MEILGDDGGPAEVIGIAQNAKYAAMNEPPMPFLYRSYEQGNETFAALFIETEGSPETLTSAVTVELHNIAPNMPIFDIRTMRDHFLENGLLEARFGIQTLMPLAAVALILGVLGLYGVIAYSVGQRAHEIGIRMALGASDRQVLRMVLLQGLRPSGIAAVLGIGLSLVLKGIATDFAANVNPYDPTIYFAVLFLILIVSGAASYIPARRASTVDPNVTLRNI